MKKRKKIGSESSGEQHGWGQFGYLYLNADDPGVAQACLMNIDILLNSYPMPGNNLIADESGQLISKDPDANESWYRAEHLLLAKKAARKWMKRTAKQNPTGSIAERLKREKKDLNVPAKLVIESHDRPMRSTRILTSIHHRFKKMTAERL